MGEERYVKQIISDVMEMAAKIKFLEAKVAASESWSAECTDDHKRELAAALRRAKAEALKELSEVLTYGRFNSYEQGMCERGCGLTKEGRIGASIGLAWALGEIDARAAQIEEGVNNVENGRADQS